MKELCAQRWCSQMVANNHASHDYKISRCLRTGGYYDEICDWTQTWCSTPQGGEYWQQINSAWKSGH